MDLCAPPIWHGPDRKFWFANVEVEEMDLNGTSVLKLKMPFVMAAGGGPEQEAFEMFFEHFYGSDALTTYLAAAAPGRMGPSWR